MWVGLKYVWAQTCGLPSCKVKLLNRTNDIISEFKGIGYLRYFFLFLNLEAWNLACVCKTEIP